MAIRPVTRFMALLASLTVLLTILLVSGRWRAAAARSEVDRMTALARNLRLTDLCLFTEANYTRHPSMADLSTPFQSSPGALEHFPSGSLLQPPPHLTGGDVRHD